MNRPSRKAFVFLLFAYLWSLVGTADAARVDLDLGTIRRQGGAAVAATMHDVEEIVEKDPPDGHGEIRSYRFKLRVAEALYGEGISAGNVIPIDASYAGCGTVWEGTEATAGYGDLGGNSRKPPEGTRVIAYLKPAKDGRRDLYGYSSSVLVLNSFDDPRMEMWRRIAKLWAMPVSAELGAKVIEGCHSNNLPYQMYCLEVAKENRSKEKAFPGFTGIWMEGVVGRGALGAELSRVFTDDKTPFEAAMYCDQIICGGDAKTRGPRQMNPMRYDALYHAIKRNATSDKTIDWQRMSWAVSALAQCPSRGDQTRDLILQLIESKETAPPGEGSMTRTGNPMSVLPGMRALYVPNAAGDESRKLNEQIVQDLTKRLNDRKMGPNAASVLWSIGEDYASVGIVKSDIIDLLQSAKTRGKGGATNAEDDPQHEMDKMYLERIHEEAPRARAAIGETKLPAVLSWPYDEQLDQRVYVVSRGVGHPAGVWIEGDRPRTPAFPEYVIAIGTLKKQSVPYFLVNSGQDWGEGIPVPPGARPESIAVRYVLENPTWVVVPHSPPAARK